MKLTDVWINGERVNGIVSVDANLIPVVRPTIPLEALAAFQKEITFRFECSSVSNIARALYPPTMKSKKWFRRRNKWLFKVSS